MAPLPLARVLLLVMLLGGIITMHAVTVTVGHDAVASTSTVGHHAKSGHAQPADTPCAPDDCQQHTGLHGCVFILTAIAIAAGLMLLCWIGIDRAEPLSSRMRRLCRRRQRAPPWTVLSLYELSILRV